MASGIPASFALKSVHGLDTSDREKKAWGAYGAVYKVTVDGVPCIAKRLHDILVNPEVPQKQRASIQLKFHDECTLLSQLRHPNVVHFVGVHYGSNKDDISLIMECLDTDLARCLDSQPTIPIEVKLLILLDVSYGLLYLHTHSPQIIHRDLTAANILLTRDKRAKIADLGVSKLLDPSTQAAVTQTKAPGTHYYMPPEALKENPKYDVKLDIFSFGQLALYVINQDFPQVFEVTITPDVLRQETLQIAKRRKAVDEMGRDHCLHDVVVKCLQDNPQKRPTTLNLNEMLNHLCMKHPREYKDARIAWLEGGIAEMETALSKAEHDRQGVLQELSSVKQQRDTLDEKCLSLLNLNEKLKRQLSKFDSIFDEIAQVKLKASRWEAALSSQRSELSKLRRENGDLKGEIEARKAELAELKGHSKDLKPKTKTEEKPAKDAEKVKQSNEGNTTPDRTGVDKALDEKITEKEQPFEELREENDTLQDELSAPLPTMGSIDLKMLKEFEIRKPYEGGSCPDQTLESTTRARAHTVATEVGDESSRQLTVNRIPYDPYLTCPKCKKQFWIGEIQKYRAHVNKQCVDHMK